MAALGWLLNLNMAGGVVGVSSVGGEAGVEIESLRRRPYAYSYGYQYIVRGVAWTISSLLR